MAFDCTEICFQSVATVVSTSALLFLIVIWPLLRLLSRRFAVTQRDPVPSSPTGNDSTLNRSAGVLGIVSEDDLKNLIVSMEGGLPEKEKWENIIVKKNDRVSYTAKCCRQKDGPLKYFSVTTFENCSTELLRDFYMDNEYRKEWDKTLIQHEQLEVDEYSGIEIGRIIKKFPLLTPREYILAWRVWEGKEKSFYCFTKECEHSLAPRQRKYVRVGFFRSGWRIRKVPDRDGCEITMVYEEDAGLNIEMAKIAFAKGIWSYISKMEITLRQYSSTRSTLSKSILTLQRLILKVPPELETGTNQELLMEPVVFDNQERVSVSDKRSRSSSKKWIANGLLLIGGIACLSRYRSTLGTQLAAAFILKKLMKPESESYQLETSKLRRGRHSRSHYG